MKQPVKYKIIAFFLLMVFSSSTLAGFACSMGIGRAHQTGHHEHKEFYSDGVDTKIHQVEHSLQTHALLPVLKIADPDEDCCIQDVTSFIRLDKSLVELQLCLQAPAFLLGFTSVFILQGNRESKISANPKFQFVRRCCFLNDTDIRIAIQSFQI